MCHFSHTHSAPPTKLDQADRPGGDLIEPYLDRLAVEVAAAVTEALGAVQPASIVFGQADSDMAGNRDLWDAESDQYVCGFNPDGPFDPDRARGSRHRCRRGAAGDPRQLRLPCDDARLAELAHQPRLPRRDARGRRGGDRGAVRVPPGGVGRHRPARRLRRRHRRWPIATDASWATRRCRPSRRSRRPRPPSATRVRRSRARRSACGNTCRSATMERAAAARWRRRRWTVPLAYRDGHAVARAGAPRSRALDGRGDDRARGRRRR